MEGYCSTGQSPQWAVVPVEEEEEGISDRMSQFFGKEGDGTRMKNCCNETAKVKYDSLFYEVRYYWLLIIITTIIIFIIDINYIATSNFDLKYV
jgi:hypothetical protein